VQGYGKSTSMTNDTISPPLADEVIETLFTIHFTTQNNCHSRDCHPTGCRSAAASALASVSKSERSRARSGRLQRRVGPGLAGNARIRVHHGRYNCRHATITCSNASNWRAFWSSSHGLFQQVTIKRIKLLGFNPRWTAHTSAHCFCIEPHMHPFPYDLGDRMSRKKEMA
jgi:hypothetical protein